MKERALKDEQRTHDCINALHVCSGSLQGVQVLTLSGMGGFWTDISKCSEGEGDQIFRFFFHRDIRNKKVCKVKNFQVWVASRYFE